MPRAVWTGALSFGPVSIPVAPTRSIEELMEALKRSVEEAKSRAGHEDPPRRQTG